MTNPSYKKYLEQFPQSHRGWLGGLFNQAVRRGARTTEQVLVEVKRYGDRQLADPYTPIDRTRVYCQLVESLHSPLARQYAAYVLQYEQLSLPQRQAIKADKAEQGRQEWRGQHPPTIKQLNYLASLGYKGQLPKNKGEASRFIDQLLKNSEKGRAA